MSYLASCTGKTDREKITASKESVMEAEAVKFVSALVLKPETAAP